MSTNYVTDANGKKLAISLVRRVCWHVGDEDDVLDRSVIIGRCLIDIVGGGQLHGLVVASPYRITLPSSPAPSIRDLDDTRNWSRYAVWWDRYTSRFVATEMPS
jgi:hypothetical protein